MTRAIIFDCFGVLYVDPTSYFYNIALKRHNSLQASQFTELIRQTDSGLISRKEFSQQVAGLFGVSADFVQDKLLKGVARNTEMVEYSQQLRQNFKIGLLSNISRGTMELFFSPKEQQKLFDDVVLSSEVGCIKPQAEIFHLAARRLAVGPQEIIFIDDNEVNCAGAKKVGMRAIHHKANHQTIQEIEELLI